MMAQYLSNIDASETNAFRTYVAALRSGQNVVYLNCPMPPEWDEENSYYSRAYASGELNNMACICGINNEYDYSRFWHEWDSLK